MGSLALTAELTERRKVLLTWTYDSNADFQLFWKKSIPAGSDFVLLETTNAFTYTTADLEPSIVYSFYVRANVGETFVYSNTVELFVSCGKGVVLEPDPPPSPPGQVPFVDVYAAAETSPIAADIFKQDAQSGLFNAQGWGGVAFSLRGMCASPNGDVYVAREAGVVGDIYKQTGGVGNFVALNQTSRRWYVMGTVPNGDIYAGVYGGDIYKQTGGAGAFVALGQTSRGWFGMTGDALGNVYACENGGDIYIRIGGVGDFIALNQTNRTWRGMCAAPNGKIYCADFSGDIYTRNSGVGDFISIGFPGMNIRAMCATRNGDIYAAGESTASKIYIQTRGVGNFVPTGDPVRNYLGMAARAF